MRDDQIATTEFRSINFCGELSNLVVVSHLGPYRETFHSANLISLFTGLEKNVEKPNEKIAKIKIDRGGVAKMIGIFVFVTINGIMHIIARQTTK